VICRFAGTVDTGLPGAALAGRGTITVVLRKAGMYLLTGSFSSSLPSSSRIRAAVVVIAFDCEAMRKIVSVRIGTPLSTSALPTTDV
jgi:hypothetical protein